MIVAIEGLIPDRRVSPSATQPAAPPVEPDIYAAAWRREQQQQPVGEEPTRSRCRRRNPDPPRPSVPRSTSQLPSQPSNRPAKRRLPNLDGTNPALSIPSSTPEARTGFPTRPATSSMPFWTEGAPSGCPFPQINASLGRVAEVDKKPNFIEFYKISRSRDANGAASAGRNIALHHRLRDRGQYSFGVGKTTQRKSKAHTPRYTQPVFPMHWYPMRERWASLASSAEFHEGSRTSPDGRIRKLLRIGLPIIQAGSSDPKSGSIPKLEMNGRRLVFK